MVRVQVQIDESYDRRTYGRIWYLGLSDLLSVPGQSDSRLFWANPWVAPQSAETESLGDQALSGGLTISGVFFTGIPIADEDGNFWIKEKLTP